jgi:Ca2+-transporting ATPase
MVSIIQGLVITAGILWMYQYSVSLGNDEPKQELWFSVL